MTQKIFRITFILLISSVLISGCVGNFHASIKACVEPNDILPQVAAKDPGTVFYRIEEKTAELMKIHVIFVSEACADITTDIDHGDDYIDIHWVEGITQEQMTSSKCDCNCQYEITFSLKEPPQDKEIRIQGIPLEQLEQLYD